jgi:hypothetical protein
LRSPGERALTSRMQDEDEINRPWVTFGFSRTPKPSYEEMIEEDARASTTVRLSAIIKDGAHGFKAVVILYTTSPGVGYATAHQLLGTHTAHESRMGPLGLKTQ